MRRGEGGEISLCLNLNTRRCLKLSAIATLMALFSAICTFEQCRFVEPKTELNTESLMELLALVLGGTISDVLTN
jgi:hypothetical protein